jgi:predicted lysophospholipase L1 biosynthesis ABC-type transport system permease subunit
VVRNALGASRGRIVAQLFLEALVLGALAATAGLAGADDALGAVMRVYAAEAGGGSRSGSTRASRP